MTFRIYIDESGDHTFNALEDLSRRYLGLTGVVFRKSDYDPSVPERLEWLKRRHLPYDVDFPPVLTRKHIIERKAHFAVLQDEALKSQWENDLVEFLASCPMNVFTVVLDKRAHLDTRRGDSWKPYSHSLGMLLELICGWLNHQEGGYADIIAESRGGVEDRELLAAYVGLRNEGTSSQTAESFKMVYPEQSMAFKRKEHNIAGLQVADILAAEQKTLIVLESGWPLARQVGPFGQRVNEAIRAKARVNWRQALH